MRIKIKTRDKKTEVILDVIRVERYHENDLVIMEENMLFKLGGKFDEIFESLLKNGYADLSEYDYEILDGMFTRYAKI